MQVTDSRIISVDGTGQVRLWENSQQLKAGSTQPQRENELEHSVVDEQQLLQPPPPASAAAAAQRKRSKKRKKAKEQAVKQQ